MSLVVNNNMMAANTARNLNAHYGRLATSTQRLSSGLRINSAADDAAGLAIRELQRADIAALHQGARNANDAISMIQVADGSLGIIDEKLIRMKELAEQAATGTYDSTQRLMIESEYQAMASEITRIANATDFNGTKLLDGTLAGDHDGSGMVSEGKMKIHFGTGNDSAEDYYYVEIGECTSEAFGLGNNSTWQDVQRRGLDAFKDSLLKQIKADENLSDEDKGKLLAQLDAMAAQVNDAISGAVDYKKAFELWGMTDGDPDNYQISDDEGFLKDGKQWVTNSTLMEKYLAAANNSTSLDKIIKATDKVVIDIADQVAANIANSVDASIKTAFGATDLTPLWTTDSADKRDEVIAGILKAAQPDVPAGQTTVSPAYSMDTASLKSLLEKTWDDTAMTAGADALQKMANALQTAISGGNTAATGLADISDPHVSNDILNAALAQQQAKVAQNPDAVAAEIAKEGTAVAGGPDNFSIDGDIAKEITSAINVAISDAITKANNSLKTAGAATQTELDAAKDATIAAAKAAFKAAASPTVTDEQLEALGEAIGAAWGNPGADTAGVLMGQIATVTGAWETAGTSLAAPMNTGAGVINKAANEKAQDVVKNSSSSLDTFWNKLRPTEQQKLQYAFGRAALYNLANAPDGNDPTNYGISAEALDFAKLADINDPNGIAKRMLDTALDDMYAKVGHMDFAGHTVETQEDAQMALDAINEAIVSKDKIRAHLGAAQNRLENTVSNLNIQAENLQAAESRISDVDVATEMTQFVRNQILTQSAVAMLSQANSLPQMAMQLIGG